MANQYMQPDLPWNVAGIPPEAREAARAAARREGLSVGEWLTRKILRTLSDAASGFESIPETRRSTASAAATYRNVAESAAAATRETEDMLARVSRSEDQSQSAYRKIEEHLKGVARRLDAAERSQAESNRAMSKAAAEINVTAREQAQAVDQLDGHVTALAERLARVEQHASGGSGLKDAVKALHTGLSRLADQIADTANNSAAQIATLAENVESLAGRLAQARNEADTATQALEDHLLAIDARVATIEKDDGASEALSGLHQTLDTLSSRLSESETANSTAMTRLEESLGNLEHRVQDTGFEQRLQTIEKTLADLTARSSDAATDALKDELHKLAERVEAADKQHRRDIEELREAMEKAREAAKVQAAEPAPPPPPQSQPVQPQAQPAQTTMADSFDLPPFPAQTPAAEPAPLPPAQTAQPMADDFDLPPHQDGEFASPPPFEHGPVSEHHFSGVQPFDTVLGDGADQGDPYGPGASAESFIARTRRQARAAAAEAATAQPNGAGAFNWGAGVTPEKKPGGRSTRMLLIGAIVLFAIVALVAANLFFRAGNNARNAAAKPATQTSSLSNPPIAGSALPSDAAEQTMQQAAAQSANDSGDKTASASSTPAKPAATAPAKSEPAAKPVPKQAAPQKTASLTPMQELTSAAKGGSATAQTILGFKYLDGEGVTANEAEGARWLERAAKQGQPVAEYRLGTLYERGHGVPADAKQAAIWYEAAAKQGNRKAMHNLAVAYAQGSGVPKNFTVAAQWFARAAELGLRDSQFNLAVLYERGMGVKQSLSDAYTWYAIAAAQGDSESKARVAALATQLSASARVAAQRAADHFKPKTLDRAANVPPATGDL